MKKRSNFLGLILVVSGASTFAVTPKISVGYDHMLLLKSDGTVWSWGSNGSGQLGINSNTASSVPIQVNGLTGVVDVVARQGGFSMALKADGTVWIWGNNSNDLIGVTTSGGIFNKTPTIINSLRSMVGVAASFDGFTAYALDTGGKVWSWGSNGSGELGDGSTNRRSAPATIAGLDNVVQLALTSDQASALRKDGSIYSWGYNATSDTLKLGHSLGGYAKASLANVAAATALDASNSNTSGLFWAIDTQGRVMSWGDTNSGLLTCNQNTGNTATSSLAQPYLPTGLSIIKQISGGGTYALFLDATGTVFGCGDNSWGQLGDGTTQSTTTGSSPPKYGPVKASGLPSNVTYVAAGFYASAAIAADGGVWTWGSSGGGLGGVLTATNTNTQPVSVGVNAGTSASVPATFASTQVGSLNSTSLSIGMAVAPSHIGVTGEIYLVGVLPSGQIYTLNSANNFVPFDPTKPIVPLAQGALPAKYPLSLDHKCRPNELGRDHFHYWLRLGNRRVCQFGYVG